MCVLDVYGHVSGVAADAGEPLLPVPIGTSGDADTVPASTSPSSRVNVSRGRARKVR